MYHIASETLPISSSNLSLSSEDTEMLSAVDVYLFQSQYNQLVEIYDVFIRLTENDSPAQCSRWQSLN